MGAYIMQNFIQILQKFISIKQSVLKSHAEKNSVKLTRFSVKIRTA